MKEIDQEKYKSSQFLASRVDFIKTKEEFDMYTSALYLAKIWGEKYNEQSQVKEPIK